MHIIETQLLGDTEQVLQDGGYIFKVSNFPHMSFYSWNKFGLAQGWEKLPRPHPWCYDSDTKDKDVWRIPEMSKSSGLHSTSLYLLCIVFRVKYTLGFPSSVCLHSRGKSAAKYFR